MMQGGLYFPFWVLKDSFDPNYLLQQPQKILVELVDSGSNGSIALWSALIGATVSALIALTTQLINLKSQRNERNHQAKLITYQMQLQVKQGWANELINEISSYVSCCTAVHNISHALYQLISNGRQLSPEYDKHYTNLLGKKELLGRGTAKISMLLGGDNSVEAREIITTLEEVRQYLLPDNIAKRGSIELDAIRPYFLKLYENTKKITSREVGISIL